MSSPRITYSSSRVKIQDQERKEANEPKYFQSTLKRGRVTHQKEDKSPTHESSNLSTVRTQSLALLTMHTSPAPLVPDRIPSQESPLSLVWIHAITILFGNPLTSEVGQHIQKWIMYQANLNYIKFAIKWDSIQFDNKRLQKYEETNGSISYLKSNTVKQLVSLNIYMILLICQDRPDGQNYHPTHFIKGEQLFKLTAIDLKHN